MKYIWNKFYIISFVFFLSSTVLNAQQDTISNRFAYHSFSVSPTGIYLGSEDVGLALREDVNFNYGKHIFSVGVGTGYELVVLGHSDFYQQANILYGREFQLTKRTIVDLSAGAGYFRYNTYGLIDYAAGSYGEINTYTIGFPITAKLRFMLSRRFSMGLQTTSQYKFGGNNLQRRNNIAMESRAEMVKCNELFDW